MFHSRKNHPIYALKHGFDGYRRKGRGVNVERIAASHFPTTARVDSTSGHPLRSADSISSR